LEKHNAKTNPKTNAKTKRKREENLKLVIQDQRDRGVYMEDATVSETEMLRVAKQQCLPIITHEVEEEGRENWVWKTGITNGSRWSRRMLEGYPDFPHRMMVRNVNNRQNARDLEDICINLLNNIAGVRSLNLNGGGGGPIGIWQDNQCDKYGKRIYVHDPAGYCIYLVGKPASAAEKSAKWKARSLGGAPAKKGTGQINHYFSSNK